MAHPRRGSHGRGHFAGREILNMPETPAIVSWAHFGDPHIKTEAGQNYKDLCALIFEVNTHLRQNIDFAFLPGDIAEDGTRDQYELARKAIETLRCPLFAIPGDHDRKTGDLANFRRFVQAEPQHAFSLGSYHFIFLNALDGELPSDFDLSPAQGAFLEARLAAAGAQGLTPVLFMHTYPSELQLSAPRVVELIRKHKVLLVEMGHTHYNELANDGHTIYAATRSTGQIEEGPAGLSLTALDDRVLSWRFKPLGHWPFALITFPADRRLITDPSHPGQVLRRTIAVRAKAWGADPIVSATLYVNGNESAEMSLSASPAVWRCQWDSTRVSNGEHALTVRVIDQLGRSDEDSISVVVRQEGAYQTSLPAARDLDNSVGAWPAKGILGTQLGPNKNGRKW